MVYYSPLMPEILEDPYPIYKQLRAEAPAYYVEEFDCWALSRFDAGDASSRVALAAEVNDAAALGRWLERYGSRLSEEGSIATDRQARMLLTNPKFVLRNWIAQEVIEAAESGAFELIETVRQVMATPFAEHPEWERFAAAPPLGAPAIVVSCSS